MLRSLKKFLLSLTTTAQDEPMSEHFERLKTKLEERHEEVKTTLWNKHQEALQWAQKAFSIHQLTAGSLGGLLLLSAPAHVSLPKPQVLLAAAELDKPLDTNLFLVTDLKGLLPQDVVPLTTDQENQIGNVLTDKFGFRVTAELQGKKLNRSYGYIGAEQHLARYPGDSMSTHFATPEEAERFTGSGMAPGLGAWGYFASSKDGMTQQESDREKYYIAVQTFLAAGYLENTKEMNEFFKYRKMLVLNPENGKAMIVVIGDAGPAEWTGKHLGGSPEVMNYLERFDGAQKGPVLYFFVDDPDDRIPLGPVHVK